MAATTDDRPMRERMTEYILDLQDRIVTALEDADPSAPKFKRDSWTRAQGGYGTSCVFAAPLPSSFDGLSSATDQQAETVLEKAGVNISVVHGLLPPAAIRQMVADHATIPFDPSDPNPKSLAFFAAGISLVIHPRNPSAPTVHANYRYFELTEPDTDKVETTTATATEAETDKNTDKNKKPLAWWFGGGADLTPSYFFESDARHFHQTLKAACDPHGAALHSTFKKWCDEYFFITHRGESRGIGGIFFDDLSDGPHKRLPFPSPSPPQSAGTGTGDRPTTPSGIFSLVRSCGDAFIPSYLPILSLRAHTPYTPAMRRWQLLRRGRYVEFNLVYDRGTKFGLMTPGARVESILMSLPETARWEYMSEVGTLEGSEEAKLVEVLKNPRDWA